jgi:hypothetical protein
MPSNEELRKEFKDKAEPIVRRLNEVLQGRDIIQLEPVLARIGRNGKLPHWYADLRDRHTLPNLDGKTIGSVIEMLLAGVLETFTFKDYKLKLRVNPARGTDLPDLDLNIKSPSTNYCTSEPFFSAYERLIGSHYDAVILLTDYQKKKDRPPLKLQILRWQYLRKTEIADKRLCKIALKNREFLLGKNEVWARKMFRFLAYLNQSDWRAKQLLSIADALMAPERIEKLIANAERDFSKQNGNRTAKNKTLIPDSDLESIIQIKGAKPVQVIDALDTWVEENLQGSARMPGPDEWKALKEGPLNGKIGMSFALQWRFNLRQIFNGKKE